MIKVIVKYWKRVMGSHHILMVLFLVINYGWYFFLFPTCSLFSENFRNRKSFFLFFFPEKQVVSFYIDLNALVVSQKWVNICHQRPILSFLKTIPYLFQVVKCWAKEYFPANLLPPQVAMWISSHKWNISENIQWDLQ